MGLGRLNLKRIIYLLSLASLISACGNPLGSAGTTTITEGHNPFQPSDPAATVLASATDSSLISEIKNLANDSVATAGIKVTVRDSGQNTLANKTVSLASSRGASDTVTPATAVTDSQGEAQFQVSSLVAGAAELTATVVTDSVSVTQKAKVYFLNQTPVIDLISDFAAGNGIGINNPGATTTWKNQSSQGASYDGALTNFSLIETDSTSQWQGTSPRNLSFDGVNDFVSLGTGMNASANFSFEAWNRVTTLGAGQVIVSNGDNNQRGLTLRNSWDGQGYLSAHRGNASYAETVLSDSPVAYWRLGEASGTSFFNSTVTTGLTAVETAGVSNAEIGALANDSSTAAGFTRPAANNGALIVPDHPDLDGTARLTVEAWVYMDAACNSAICGIVSKRVGSLNEEAYILYTNNGLVGVRLAGQTAQQLDAGATLSTNTWHHIVFVFDNTLNDTVAQRRLKLYINGTLNVERTYTFGAIAGTASTFTIGSLNGNTSSGWAGRIDEVAVYKSAMTLAQVQKHYNARQLHAVHSTNKISTSQWSHVASSFNTVNGELAVYLNGTKTQKTYNSGVITGSTNSLKLGAGRNYLNTADSDFLSGQISDFRFYDRVLTPAEVNVCRSVHSSRHP